MSVRLSEPMTQEAFAELIGVGQPAVSGMAARGVLAPGASGAAWLLAYCAHMREMAAGRDPDGRLTSERTRVAKQRADSLAMGNARLRAEVAPVDLLEAALAHVAGVIVGHLQATRERIAREDLPPQAANHLDAELAACCALMAGARLADADRLSGDDPEDDEAEATDGRS